MTNPKSHSFIRCLFYHGFIPVNVTISSVYLPIDNPHSLQIIPNIKKWNVIWKIGDYLQWILIQVNRFYWVNVHHYLPIVHKSCINTRVAPDSTLIISDWNRKAPDIWSTIRSRIVDARIYFAMTWWSESRLMCLWLRHLTPYLFPRAPWLGLLPHYITASLVCVSPYRPDGLQSIVDGPTVQIFPLRTLWPCEGCHTGSEILTRLDHMIKWCCLVTVNDSLLWHMAINPACE